MKTPTVAALSAVLLLCGTFGLTNALKCYACASSGSLDPRCEKSPGSVASANPIITCSLKYCTTRRQEFVDPQGTISSFFRGCEERPLYSNKVVTDGNLMTSYRACQTDLCNGDDGTVSTDAGAGGGGWLDNGQWGGPDGGLVMAPGLGAAGAAKANAVLVASLACVIVALQLRGSFVKQPSASKQR